nr:MAG TPA: hypothetical protein [Caudoviricetes sp.]
MKKFVSLFGLVALMICFGCTKAFSITESVSVPKGTVVPIAYAIKVSSRDVKQDEQIPVYVAKDVYVNDKLVFQKGAKGYISVFDVYKVQTWSLTDYKKGGFIEFDGGAIADVNGVMRKFDYDEKVKGADLDPNSARVTIGDTSYSGLNPWNNVNASSVATSYTNGYSIVGKNAEIPKDTRFRVKTSEAFVLK